MSTEYKIVEGENVTLIAYEHSGRFDLLFERRQRSIPLAEGLEVFQLAEVGLKLLETALFNCADTDEFTIWLHKRVDELYCSDRPRTPAPLETP